jgi:uncharacterized protein
LIALAVQDHKVRVHTGYGLEPILPDSWCGSLSREAAATYFKGGRYSDGLVFMVKAVAFQVAAAHGVTLTGIPEQVHHLAEQQDPSATILLIIFVLIFVFIMWRNYRNQRRDGNWRNWGGGPGMWMNQPWSGGSSWGGSFGGGESGGGSFGGGSFGGGGSTGGGGGGASW